MDTRPTFPELGNRGVAFLFDALIVMFPAFAIAGLADDIKPGTGSGAAWAFIAAYCILPTTLGLKGTPGKRLNRLKVTDLAGNPVSIGRSAVRFVVSVPSIGFAGVGFLVAAFTRKRQALHDLAAGTVVVDARATPAMIANETPPALPWATRIGHVLLMGFLTLVIAVPVTYYREQRLRNAMWTVVPEVTAYREQVTGAMLAKRPIPEAARVPRHAKSLSARSDGTVVLEFSDDLYPGGRITFKPTVDAAGAVQWTCRAENMDQTYVPGQCRR